MSLSLNASSGGDRRVFEKPLISFSDTRPGVIPRRRSLAFSRDVVLSSVLSGVREIAKSHPNCKRPVDWTRESGFRYIFHHPEDRNRELIVTVLAFFVPT